MAKLLLTPEDQIQRLNALLNFVASLKELEFSELTKRPNEKSWNTLEVLEHLNIAYSPYRPKIATALQNMADSDGSVWNHQPGFWNRFIIKGQRPKGKKRPFKIKTLKKFEPILPEKMGQNDAMAVFQQFKESYGELKRFILESRQKQIQHQRISSAIGPIIKFHLPEAFEFLICHAERHKVQIDGILASHT